MKIVITNSESRPKKILKEISICEKWGWCDHLNQVKKVTTIKKKNICKNE